MSLNDMTPTKLTYGKYTTRKFHTKLHPGLEWRIFHILANEDIKFVS